MSTPSDSPSPETTELDPNFVPPPDSLQKESSPVFDSLTTPSDEDNEVEENEEATETPETAKAFKLDITRALERDTQDGKGDEDPGESNWQGYATEGVEVEDD